MKGKQLLSLALALVMLLGLSAPALAAADAGGAPPQAFPDLERHWAKDYVQDMIDRGMVMGYEDGTFRPDEAVTWGTGLAFCERIMVPLGSEVRQAIQASRLEQTTQLVPDSTSWFRGNAAVCLELGLLTEAELAEMMEGVGEPGCKFSSPMKKSQFSVYLVKSLGLEDLALANRENLTLPFSDASSIPADHLPYVYVLSQMGVLTGDDHNNFNPYSDINRAVCATMISRALSEIVEKETVAVSPEIPRFTTYSFVAGYVSQVEPTEEMGRAVTLTTDLSQPVTVELPAGTTIYKYNKKDYFTALKAGAYAKVCYGPDGTTVSAVRVTPVELLAPETVEGVCDMATADEVVVAGVSYPLDRFTMVKAGGRTGGPDIIDPDAGYAQARIGANAKGGALWVELIGGTRKVEGVLTDVSIETSGLNETANILVTAYSGLPTHYRVNGEVVVTTDGRPSTLLENYKGRHVTLRVAVEDLSDLKSMDVEANGQYVQGVLQAVVAANRQVAIAPNTTSRATSYDLAGNCEISYMDAPSALANIPQGAFATGRLEGGTLTMLSAWQGYQDTRGTITAIAYGDPTILEVTQADNTVARFSIPTERLTAVEITTGGHASDIGKMHRGDSVVVTALYYDVTRIVFTAQEANVSGVVDRVVSNSDGSWQLTLRFDDGTTGEYTAAAATTVTRGETVCTMRDVTVNAQVSMVAEGDQVMSIQLSGTATVQNTLQGTIYQKDDRARTLMVLRANAAPGDPPVSVSVPANVKVMSIAGEDLRSIAQLNTGDSVTVYGAYNANGVLVASLVIRE